MFICEMKKQIGLGWCLFLLLATLLSVDKPQTAWPDGQTSSDTDCVSARQRHVQLVSCA